MLQIIAVVVLFVVGVAVLVWDGNSGKYRDWPEPVGFLSIVVAVMWGVVVLVSALTISSNINQFDKQKLYFQTHKPASEIEDAALTQKKIEYNEWLYNAQWSKNKFGAWSLYDDEILEYEPIQ